jgi:hypothetical protein
MKILNCENTMMVDILAKSDDATRLLFIET